MSDLAVLLDLEDVDVELLRLFDDLGRYASTVAVSEAAEVRRRESIERTRGEIARLQRLAAELGSAGHERTISGGLLCCGSRRLLYCDAREAAK